MSLQLILGSSGTGKSHYMYEEAIRNSMEHEDTNYIVIVPEQFTMQTQKDLVSMHPNKGIMNIDILSFLRLAYRVFDEVGGNEKVVLEDTGKSMILRKVVELKKNSLRYLGSNAKKQGFISELKSLLSEIYQYSITPEQLEDIVKQSDKKPMLQSKLKDIITIYQGFREFIREKYITAEEILDVLVDVVDQSGQIRNSVLCFDGFTGFTPSQYKLLRKLLKCAKEIVITVTIDSREDITKVGEDFKLFHLSKKTIIKLLDIAKEENVNVKKPIYLNTPYRYQSSQALASLEHNLFRYPYTLFQDEQDDISIHLAKDQTKEVGFVVREIKRLMKEESYRYKDIAVVTGDIESFCIIIDREFDKAGIPVFIDHKKDILANPFVELIISVLEMVCKDFTYESVFRYLKSGFIDIEREDIDRIENYVIALGIRGFSMWNKEWKGKYKSKTEIDLEQINAIRSNIIQSLQSIRETLINKKSNVKDYTVALYEFIVSLDCQNKLKLYSENFKNNHQPLLAKEYSQIYRIVIELFDKIVDLLGDEIMSLKEYSEILKAGFAEAKVGLIPPGLDQIVVGDIERTRLKDIKALFFIGVNDGIIPKASGSGGIISDMEREILADNQIELAPTKRQSAYIEQFYLYLNLTKPQNKLYITLSKVDSSGKSLRASYLISKLMKLFPSLKLIDEENIKKDLTSILNGDNGIDYLIQGLREYKDRDMTLEWKELFRSYLKEDAAKEKLNQLIDAAFYRNEEKGLSKAVANALYGNELSNSVTRLEKYAACAYAHFLAYGLELIERQEYKIAVLDLGNIFHNSIEIFSDKLQKSDYNWHTVTEEVRDLLVEQSVEEASNDYGNNILKSSKRNEYMIGRVKRITKRTIWALCEQVKKGKFEPSSFELSFSYLDNLESVNVALSEKENMRLKGRIDRIDVVNEEEHVYVKIIDYKSGNTSFDVVSFYHGLQLQLVVYMNAALELERKKNPGKTVEPAGIFYYNINDPIVEKVIGENSEQSILKELKMNGIVNSDSKIVKLLDYTFANEEGMMKGSVKSDVIPVETNKDGAFTKRSSTASKFQFDEMSRFVNNKIKEIGCNILEGSTCIEPYKLGKSTACDYCEYSGICGFDLKLPGNKYRTLKKFEKEEVWDKLSSSDSNDSDETISQDADIIDENS